MVLEQQSLLINIYKFVWKTTAKRLSSDSDQTLNGSIPGDLFSMYASNNVPPVTSIPTALENELKAQNVKVEYLRESSKEISGLSEDKTEPDVDDAEVSSITTLSEPLLKDPPRSMKLVTYSEQYASCWVVIACANLPSLVDA